MENSDDRSANAPDQLGSPRRGPALTIVALMFSAMALSNLAKPVLESDALGFVLFGVRLSGTANLIFGPLFGLFLLTYAFNIWKMRRCALWMAYGYAAFVASNLVLFRLIEGRPAGGKWGALAAIGYNLVALAVPVLSAVLLRRRRGDLA